MTHAMCEYYGHEWSTHTLKTSLAKRYITVEVCDRCGEERRVFER